jgi:hypothetical protein
VRILIIFQWLLESAIMQYAFFTAFAITSFLACTAKKQQSVSTITYQPEKMDLIIEPFYAVNQHSPHGDIKAHPKGGDSLISEYYLINRADMNDSIIATLDSFSCTLIGKRLVKFDQHVVTFYHKTEMTNNEYLLKNPRTLNRFSNDHDKLATYRWFRKCGNGFRMLLKNNVPVSDERVKCNCNGSSEKK